ncbi:hypothetical protein [Fusobacterium nucleatum]|uniref:hypothetical protein n=1 Tax=Fusobacterium nucleatum TaxID=851 RepID=UPI000426620D|nr:hypothetical protein [Fusobacterium nucleatum]ALF24710.1 hypothetical protein RO05_10145 [Fusobacterium nucleatum subsp. nucleatum ChDC F316]ASG26054.1 hypothetical protein RN84_03730 [Fusobacterium nucleatum subsp. nucleatum]
MEKLEYQMVRDFIIDLGNFLEDKKADKFNWEFVNEKNYLFTSEVFSNIKELEFNARFIKKALIEKESNKHFYEFEQFNLKYLIKIYKEIKNTEFIKDFNRVVSDCYFKIFISMNGWKNRDNTLYIEDVKVLEFLDDISTENMSNKQKEIAAEWGMSLDTNNLENLKEIARLIREERKPKEFRIGLNWKNLSEAREIVFDI